MVTNTHNTDAPYRTFFEDACEGIFISDACTGLYVDVNHAGCRLLACTREEVLGRAFVEFLGAEDADRSRAWSASISLGGRHVTEWLLRTSAGNWLPVEVTATMMSSGHCQAFMRDLRARREQEAETRRRDEARVAEEQANAMHQRVLAEVGEALLREGIVYERVLKEVASIVARELADWCAVNLVLEGDIVRRVCVVTHDPERMTACATLESFPVNRKTAPIVFDVIDSQRPVVVDDAPSLLRARGGDAKARERFIGTLEPATMVVLPLVARQRTLGTMSLGSSGSPRAYGARDLALLERLAQALALGLDNGRLHEEARHAVQTRDDLLAIVAHDLRNPLSSITLQSAKIANHANDAHICDRAAKRIQACAKHMDRLIQDLLDLSRLEAGQRLAVSPIALPPSCILAEVAEQQCLPFSIAKRTLTVEATCELPPVMADKGRIGQVIDNLLSNARKFSDKHVHLGARMDGDAVLFFVHNDGPAIPAADIPHLFERFWQAKHTQTRGTGLGLSIVQEVVKLHAGRVGVQSEAGEGTTFFFTLPVAPAEKAAGQRSPAQ